MILLVAFNTDALNLHSTWGRKYHEITQHNINIYLPGAEVTVTSSAFRGEAGVSCREIDRIISPDYTSDTVM